MNPPAPDSSSTHRLSIFYCEADLSVFNKKTVENWLAQDTLFTEAIATPLIINERGQSWTMCHNCTHRAVGFYVRTYTSPG
jgi:hypothetical protein